MVAKSLREGLNWPLRDVTSKPLYCLHEFLGAGYPQGRWSLDGHRVERHDTGIGRCVVWFRLTDPAIWIRAAKLLTYPLILLISTNQPGIRFWTCSTVEWRW
jgi:hypothetical protein